MNGGGGVSFERVERGGQQPTLFQIAQALATLARSLANSAADIYEAPFSFRLALHPPTTDRPTNRPPTEEGGGVGL